MKKFTLFTLSILFLNACNSTKKIKKNISKGDYDYAIEMAVKKLSKNKAKPKKQTYILLLEDAFRKGTARDSDNLKRLEKDNNPAVIEKIYETYMTLNDRQELIKPILPLRINKENRDANFVFIDYSDRISSSKATLSDYLYTNVKSLLQENTIESARKAYDDLKYLNHINPNFKDVDKLLEEAHFKGTNFVYVHLENQTAQIIPMRLEQDLLNFDTYALDNFWTVFHNNKEPNINYNYDLALLFKQIDISPEIIDQRQTQVSKKIKDGFDYILDSNGHVKKDSLGNAIKVDKYITVKANFIEIHQEKACHIATEVVLSNKNGDEIDSFPLESEFIFVNDFAKIDGDKRALDALQLELLNNYEMPFPTNEQMVYDSGEDLKNKLKKHIDSEDFK